jgi:hypothetical protein
MALFAAIAISTHRNWLKVRDLQRQGAVAKWLRQRIANPPSWVRLPPAPLLDSTSQHESRSDVKAVLRGLYTFLGQRVVGRQYRQNETPSATPRTRRAARRDESGACLLFGGPIGSRLCGHSGLCRQHHQAPEYLGLHKTPRVSHYI